MNNTTATCNPTENHTLAVSVESELGKRGDRLFNVDTITKTPEPDKLIYIALHQDYSSQPINIANTKLPQDKTYGDIIINRLLKSGKNSHWGCLEHPTISLLCTYFPHSVIQQARTHRLLSFDVQSMRYTSQNFIKLANEEIEFDKVIYLRPAGKYTDRFGKKYNYTNVERDKDKQTALDLVTIYNKKINNGLSEEHARGLLPFDYRQHFVMSGNLRSMFHFLDLRYKKNAQLEIRQLSALIYGQLTKWTPILSEWYGKYRLDKGFLAP